MKKLIAIVWMALLTGPFCFAQNNEVTPEYKAAFMEMMELNGSQEIYQTSIDEMFKIYENNFSDVPSEFWERLKKEMKKRSIGELSDMLVDVYAKHFSLKEIKEINAFYKTPVGKKLSETTPIITKDAMKIGEQWGRKVAEEVMKEMEEEGY